MTNIAVSKEANKLVEDLQEQLPWDVSKKEIVGNAIEDFYNKKTNSETENNADNN